MGKLYWPKILKMVLIFCFFQCMITDIEITSNSVIYSLQNGKEGYYDINSMTFHKAKYDAISDSACVDKGSPLLVNTNGYWGYIDRVSEEYVIPPKFNLGRADSVFRNGYAIISEEEYKMTDIMPYDLGYALVTHSYLFDRYGEMISFPKDIEPDSQVDQNLNLIVLNTETGKRGIACVYGNNAQIIIEPIYDDIDFFDSIVIAFSNNFDDFLNGEAYKELLSVIDLQSKYTYVSNMEYTAKEEGIKIPIVKEGKEVFICIFGHDLQSVQ